MKLIKHQSYSQNVRVRDYKYKSNYRYYEVSLKERCIKDLFL